KIEHTRITFYDSLEIISVRKPSFARIRIDGPFKFPVASFIHPDRRTKVRIKSGSNIISPENVVLSVVGKIIRLRFLIITWSILTEIVGRLVFQGSDLGQYGLYFVMEVIVYLSRKLLELTV